MCFIFIMLWFLLLQILSECHICTISELLQGLQFHYVTIPDTELLNTEIALGFEQVIIHVKAFLYKIDNNILTVHNVCKYLKVMVTYIIVIEL